MLVSVVMAVYNGEDYVREAVDSILGQSYRHFEFIIVNDGSTDGTASILDAVDDGRVQVIHLPENGGAAEALNRGIAAARGRWIAIQDADDISLPIRLEQQLHYLRSDPCVSALGSMIMLLSLRYPVSGGSVGESLGENMVKSVGRNVGESFGEGLRESLKQQEQHPRGLNSFMTYEQIAASRFYSNTICHGSVVFSRRVFEQVGGYDRRYRIAYDYDLWMRMLEAGRIEKVPRVLYLWRINPYSLSRYSLVATCSEVQEIAVRYIRRLCYGHLKRKPRFFAFGPQAGRENFEATVVPGGQIEIAGSYYGYGDAKETASAVRLLRSGHADGVIVLKGRGGRRMLRRFMRAGLQFNKNLFYLWNIFR